MAESSRNAVVDNAAKDSYFLMHIAREEERRNQQTGEKDCRIQGEEGKERAEERDTELEEDKESDARVEIKEEGERSGEGQGDECRQEKAGTRCESRFGWRNFGIWRRRLEPISRNRATDI